MFVRRFLYITFFLLLQDTYISEINIVSPNEAAGKFTRYAFEMLPGVRFTPLRASHSRATYLHNCPHRFTQRVYVQRTMLQKCIGRFEILLRDPHIAQRRASASFHERVPLAPYPTRLRVPVRLIYRSFSLSHDDDDDDDDSDGGGDDDDDREFTASIHIQIPMWVIVFSR